MKPKISLVLPKHSVTNSIPVLVLLTEIFIDMFFIILFSRLENTG